MANQVSSVDVPLDLFCGLDLELSPSDLPEGVSPANAECAFLPGSVAQRPAMQRGFATPVSSLGAFVYEKSFVTGTGAIKNLYFTPDGKLWVEDVTNTPGVATLLYTTAGAAMATSVTADYAEYICFSDRVHGADVPIFYDGTALNRLTQDGPGAPPTVQSIALPPSQLAGSAGGSPSTITTAFTATNTFTGLHWVHTDLDVTTTAAHGLSIGSVVTISGNTNAAFNLANQTVTNIVSPTEFQIGGFFATSAFSTPLSGTGGTVGTIGSNSLERNNNTVTGFTLTPHGLKVGYQVQISGVPDSNSTSVVQTNASSAQTVNGSVWDLNSGQYRSLFNPGTSALGDFVAHNFGFNVPSSATVLGVVISFGTVSQAPTTGTVDQVALWQTGALLGTAKSPGTGISTSIMVNSYGSAADQWGAALTPTIVNDPTFGFAVSVAADSVRDFLNFPFSAQVYYTLSGSGTVADIDTIVINNEVTSGQALVTTDGPHGLVPNIFVSIVGVEPGTVSNVAAAQWVAGVTTLTTATAHNLTPGCIIQVAGVTTSTGSTTFSFNGTFAVATVPSPNQVTYGQTPITATDPDVIDATASTGAVTIAWPILETSSTPTYFQVLSCPTATTFYIQMSYSDATWTTGTVGFAWEGIFFVTAVPSATEFQYQQYGPNGATSAAGTATPFGQAAPGLHQVRVSWLLPDGTISAPSPPAQFIANGGQYLQVSDLAIDPAGVAVGRIVQFTGALGAYFFYIPVPAQVNGLIVSTATQINDNTTTSILLDFSDNTLFAALATSIPGNNLQNQVVPGNMSGIFTYAERMMLWGERNKVQNLLSMGFDGGVNANTPTMPLGWSGNVDGAGSVVPARLSSVWQIAATNTGQPCGQIFQSAYANWQGNPIVQPNTLYSLYLWLKTDTQNAALTFHATISSVSTSFTSSATIAGNNIALAPGAFVTLNFGTVMPATIPTDMLLTIWATSTNIGTITLQIDDMALIFTAQPFLDTQARMSYGANFGAFDGLTGIMGAEDDQSPIRNFGTIRQTLYMVTGTGLHSTSDNGQTEPNGWKVDDIADNCGAFSIASVARNPQGIGSAGKEWMMWNGPDGGQIFDGEHPYKVSQEIQPIWDAMVTFDTSYCWTKNDETNKRCYFGIPTATVPAVADGMQILVLDYRNLGSAQSIANSPPIHISFTGKMIASDLTRKWTVWNRPAFSGDLLYHGASAPVITFGMNSGAGAQAYTLNALKYQDDDFGYIPFSYTTFFFVSHEAEQALQVGSHRKVYTMAQSFASGIGNYIVTPLAASLTNPFPASPQIPLTLTPGFDVDYGINVETTRCAFTFTTIQPGAPADAYLKIQKLVINLGKAPHATVRGSFGGTY